jgi:hypothetical protein
MTVPCSNPTDDLPPELVPPSELEFCDFFDDYRSMGYLNQKINTTGRNKHKPNTILLLKMAFIKISGKFWRQLSNFWGQNCPITENEQTLLLLTS